MDLILLNLVAFFRPVLFVDAQINLLGLNLFELAALALTLLLFVSFASHAVLKKELNLSLVDVVIVLYSAWCIWVFVIYYDTADPRALLKLVIPPLTYTVAKNIIKDLGQYRKILKLMVLGFSIPLIGSAVLVALGMGVSKVSYWTGLASYQGLYTGSHTLAHNSLLCLFALFIYYALGPMKDGTGTLIFTVAEKSLLILLVPAILFCMYKSNVRTAVLGLLVFFTTYYFFANRRIFIAGVLAVAMAITAFAPILAPRFFYDFSMVISGEWDMEKMGSGRPKIWGEQLYYFSRLRVDQQLAGIGLGNRLDDSERTTEDGGLGSSHNDFLEVAIQVGVIGFVLFLLIQAALLWKVFQLQAREKWLLLGLLLAVVAMNIASNSYVSRFGIGQLFYLLIAYADVAYRNQASINVVRQRIHV